MHLSTRRPNLYVSTFPKMALHDRIGEAFLVFGEAVRVGVGAAVVIGVGAQVAHCLKLTPVALN